VYGAAKKWQTKGVHAVKQIDSEKEIIESSIKMRKKTRRRGSRLTLDWSFHRSSSASSLTAKKAKREILISATLCHISRKQPIEPVFSRIAVIC
jgi:4-aminobutyrate aminotransferase-like enzyme